MTLRHGRCVLTKIMGDRIKSDFWISAYRRRLEGKGGLATVIRRGDADAGQIYVILRCRSGLVALLSAITEHDGGRGWRVVHAFGTSEEQISEGLSREMARDPDCWIIEAETSDHEYGIEEPIHGILREDKKES